MCYGTNWWIVVSTGVASKEYFTEKIDANALTGNKNSENFLAKQHKKLLCFHAERAAQQVIESLLSETLNENKKI